MSDSLSPAAAGEVWHAQNTADEEHCKCKKLSLSCLNNPRTMCWMEGPEGPEGPCHLASFEVGGETLWQR